MSDNPAGGPVVNPALIERVKNILLKPGEEWAKIDPEPATIGGLYKGWVIPLAAIPVLAALIGSQLFGYSVLGVTYRPPLVGSIVTAILQYVMSLGLVYVLALIIDALAPQFGGTPNRIQAFKVAAYSYTAGWVAGILALLPALSMLAILGALYGLYLLYLGLPRLMKAPADKAMAYTAVVVLVAIVASLVVAVVVAPIAASLAGPSLLASNQGSLSGSLNVPGVGSVDTGKLEAAADKMAAATKQLEAGANGQPVQALAPDVLQGLLPGAIGALARTEVSSSSAGAAGIGGSNAEARYGSGDQSITLEITDMAAMGGIAALGTAFNVQSSRQTETGYEKTSTVDGRMVTEKWDNGSKSGRYGTLVGNRFMVEADGSNVGSIDVLKAAVASIDLARLEAAAR